MTPFPIRYFAFFCAFVLSFFIVATGFAQTLPPGLRSEYAAYFEASTTETLPIPAPDVKLLEQEDAQLPEQNRISAPVSVDIQSNSAGRWVRLPDSTQVWQCRMSSEGALALIVLFDRLRFPEGGFFYAYSPVNGKVIGPVQAIHLTSSGKFTLGPIPGEEVVLEYHAPAYTRGQEDIYLNRVDYAYHPGALSPGDVPESTGFGASLNCNVNIQCPEAADWQTQKKGVARILMVFTTGSAWCSGSLIANTAGTGVPYFLTAHHCQIILSTPIFDQWAFDFNYEFASCAGGTIEPTFQSVVGCERISWRAETDFLLLKLNPIPASYGVYFNGWSRVSSPATTSSLIHHPKGDVKKYSRDNSAALSHPNPINWGGVFGTSPANTHWTVVPDVGIYEVGSSGCPMFNQDKRIVGQLHGGISNACNITASYFGMFHISWDQGGSAASRLKEWLDPANTGAMTKDGYVPPPTPVTISGSVKAWWGGNMPEVKVVLSGSATDTVTTDSNGNYVFADLPAGGTYKITPLSKPLVLNGVDAYDLILVSRHILNLEPLEPAWKLIAADVNSGGTVTTLDNVDARKVLLGSIAQFPAQKSWRYFPANTVFQDPTNPFSNLPNEFIELGNVVQNTTGVHFFGVKLGDVDKGANPGM